MNITIQKKLKNKIKADATVKSGVRLFFWSEKSGYANHWLIHKKNINWYIIFAGVVRGGNFGISSGV